MGRKGGKKGYTGLGDGKMGRRRDWGGGMGSEIAVKGWGRWKEGKEVEYIGKEEGLKGWYSKALRNGETVRGRGWGN